MKAPALLGFLLFRHYLWDKFPAEWQADVWNAIGAITVTALVWMVAARETWAIAAAAWWTFEEFQVAACSLAYLIAPFHVEPGQAQCNALSGINLVAVGIGVVGVLFWRTCKVLQHANRGSDVE